jgi:alkylhydroperoxidase family enzyme
MLDMYRREIARRLDAGDDLDEVEAEIIDVCRELSDDERAALWLFAWSYRERPALGKAVEVVGGGERS